LKVALKIRLAKAIFHLRFSDKDRKLIEFPGWRTVLAAAEQKEQSSFFLPKSKAIPTHHAVQDCFCRLIA
jgi:hypothetical protein